MASEDQPAIHFETSSLSLSTSELDDHALDIPDMLSPRRGSDMTDPNSPATPLNTYASNSNLFIRKVSDTPFEAPYVGNPYAIPSASANCIDPTGGHPSSFVDPYGLNLHDNAYYYDEKSGPHLPQYFPNGHGHEQHKDSVTSSEFASTSTNAVAAHPDNYVAGGLTEQDLADYFGLAWPIVHNDYLYANSHVQDARDVVASEPRAFTKGSQTVPMDVDIGTDDVWNEGTWSNQLLPPVPMLAPPFSPPPSATSSLVVQSPPPILDAETDATSHFIWPETPQESPPAMKATPKRAAGRKKRVTGDSAKPKRKPRASPRLKKKSEAIVKDEAPLVAAETTIPPSPNSVTKPRFKLETLLDVSPFGAPTLPGLLGRSYSEQFPEGHCLNADFVFNYNLEAEIGVGGFGFVMTARHRGTQAEVAVKFIDKVKIPEEHIVEDIGLGCFVPIEVSVLKMINHEGVVKFLEFTQDDKFYYLVQELHGSPWQTSKQAEQCLPPVTPPVQPPTTQTPANPSQLLPPHALYPFPCPDRATSVLHPSQPRKSSLPILPHQPTQPFPMSTVDYPFSPATQLSHFSFSPGSPVPRGGEPPSASFPPGPLTVLPFKMPMSIEVSPTEGTSANSSFISHVFQPISSSSPDREEKTIKASPPTSLSTLPTIAALSPPVEGVVRPNMSRRPSHDLFECIEQHKKLGEAQARYVFSQVVDTVDYLAGLGICHRDIKDENLVVDADFNVKLIDFGSAVIRDVTQPEPYYSTFFGTVSFASSEILQDHAYRAPPAEIWTLGVLLSFLVTGESPFPDKSYAIAGTPVFQDIRRDGKPLRLSNDLVDLIRGCLRPDPDKRFTIKDIKKHRWLHPQGMVRS
ncbi:hypothetical protein FRB98_008953 [Tulasnella sp. 332]|nr:hypothetical protein FRB98_008953 [Tulasnella sp. 332]